MTTEPSYGDLASLKAALGITDSLRDAGLTSALVATSRWIDNYCGRRFYLDSAVSQRVYNPDRLLNGAQFLTDDIGDNVGLIVETGSATLGWAVVTPYVETAPDNAVARNRPVTSLIRVDGIPWVCAWAGRVRLTARWGWPAVPDAVNQAAVIQAARLFKRKDSPEGVLGNSEWGAVRVSRVDPDVMALIGPFAIGGWA